MSHRNRASLLIAAALLGHLAPGAAEESDGAKARSPRRPPWTGSRIVGTPDPALPFEIERVFEKVEWRRPIYAIAEPETGHIIVIEQGGEKDRPARGRRLLDSDESSSTDVFFEIDRLVYGLTFHPRYSTNRQVFIFSNGPVGAADRVNRISRYRVSSGELPRCEEDSERVIIEWPSSGHDGGDLVFGNDGMLYISSGDGSTDSDTFVTGQDVSDLRGGILRIDVDARRDASSQHGARYSIPRDNPFVDLAGARPELWAIGLRNPWRMSIDRETGRIWVGNNGQDLWETAHLLGRGHNYGWSVYEGNHPFYLGRRLGPAPFVPPTLEHHHREARSLTGGVVYRGEGFAELDGVYVYGDYATGKIWGALHDGAKLVWSRELADTAAQIVCFANSPRGDLLMVDHGGGLYRLRRREKRSTQRSFPETLSKTGLFASVAEHRVAPGVVPYFVNAPAWADGAQAERFIAIPGEQSMAFSRDRAFGFPEKSVLVETLSLAGRRIETRILTLQDREWAGYSYLWRESGEDATLVSQDGAELDLPEFGRWRVPGRAECMSCHSRASGFVLGVTGLQLNRQIGREGSRVGQVDTLRDMGLVAGAPQAEFPALADPYDMELDLESRARSYLHVNCSPCHVEAGGGNSAMELRIERELGDMRIIEQRPRHQSFELPGAMLIAPGEPERSVLLERLRRRGPGQMPPLGRDRVDERAVELFRSWIASLEATRKLVKRWRVEDLAPGLASLPDGRSIESGERIFRSAGCAQCHGIEGRGGGIGPDLSKGSASSGDTSGDTSSATSRASSLLESIIEPSKSVAPEFATTVIALKSGLSVQGRIDRESDTTVILRTSDAFAKPLAISKVDIAARLVSQTSTMPGGILDTFEENEILDLLAYLLSRSQDSSASSAGAGESGR